MARRPGRDDDDDDDDAQEEGEGEEGPEPAERATAAAFFPFFRLPFVGVAGACAPDDGREPEPEQEPELEPEPGDGGGMATPFRVRLPERPFFLLFFFFFGGAALGVDADAGAAGTSAAAPNSESASIPSAIAFAS